MTVATGSSTVNSDVLSAINDMIGREVLINTVEKKRYSGILSAVSQDMAFGMSYVVEITKQNENNLLKAESEVIEKMVFNYADIIDFAYHTQEDKGQHLVSKFVTDRQYHGDAPTNCEDLQEWNGGEDEDGLGGSIEDDVVNPSAAAQHTRRNNHNNGTGWSVDDMFAANQKMNVVSTFKDDLTQYTTAEIVGTDEDRARAERLAREIESNSSSKFMANLENDDDERDLDKITRQEDFDNSTNQRRGKGNAYNQQSQQRRNPNVAPNGQPVNRRAEGLRGDRRNSGSSSANNSRYNAPNQPQSYQQQPQQGQKGTNYNNRRQGEDYRDNDWQMAKGKGQNQGHDHSFRQQQKQMLDPRPNLKQQEGEKGQSSGSRVTDLKTWGNEFSIATSPKEQSPAPGSTPPVAQGTSGSAWNRGPPSSLVSKGSAESTPPPAENEAPVSDTTSSNKPVVEKKEELPPSTSGEEQNETDGKPEDADNVSVTDASETSSVVTSKSSSFKFNINAPEFKPRVAPATPTPTTPTGPAPPNMNQVQPQQFVQPDYQPHQGMVPQGGPSGVPMGMQPNMIHMGQGGVPPNQGAPIMMWQGPPQGYPGNQQFPMQQVPMAGVPGQMYGAAANAPATVAQQASMNQHIPTSAAGGVPNDGRQGYGPQRRDGEYRDPTLFYYPQGPMVPVPQQFYQQPYQGPMQQPYPMKVVQQQGPQGSFPQRFQQQPVIMVPGHGPPQRYQVQPQQGHFVPDQQQGGPQSHPNSQPATPGPRGEMNGPKVQQGPQQALQQNGSGMHREPEAGSNTSLSGSASSQSGQRSGSPPNAAALPPQQPQQPPQQQQQQHQQQGPPHGAPPPHVVPQGGMVGVPPQAQYMVMQHQMHPHMQNQYYQPQQQMFYPMIVSQQMQNQHNQQSVMGERADSGFPQTNFFDYRNIPNYQQNQQSQHQQMHGSHMPRQNSIPQQFGGNQVLKV